MQFANALARETGIVERDGRYWIAGAEPVEAEGPPGSPPLHRAVWPRATRARVVAFDLETVLRQVVEPPYLERHLYQVGAVRLSRDAAWAKGGPRSFVAWTRLHPDIEPLLAAPEARAKYEAGKRDAPEVLDEFLAFCAGATHLVAYNGTGLDFPVIEAVLAKYGRALPAGLEKVDGLYLAQALWPVPPNDHRLRDLLVRIGEDVGEFFWHDARDDSRMLAKLLIAGQHKVAGWSDDRRRLVRSVGAGSAPWEMLYDLLPAKPAREEFADTDIRTIVSAEMVAGKAPIRERAEHPAETAPPPAPAEGPLAIPAALLDATGRTDVYALANAAKAGAALPRPSQDEMVRRMRGWVDAGTKALVEAPTGTGKSYAILAVALDWLAADRANRVIVSTFTKALQAQMAEDIERLAPHVPGLLETTDLVKGSANRLSLRGLLVALADLATASPRERIRGRPDFTAEPRFRDLVAYLLLRLLEQGRPTEEWLAHSVDATDVPAMFEDYLTGPRGTRRRALYLAYLSQAQSGEVGERSGELTLHTSTVRQALDEHRLIIANHALLLAHLDEFDAEAAARTLLMVDEAHALEAAATQALSAIVATPDVEVLARDVAGWLRDVPEALRTPAHRALDAALDALEDYLGFESLQEGARRAFDALGGERATVAAARRVVVDSPLAGALANLDSAAIKDGVRDLEAHVRRIDAAFGEVPPPDDPFERERHGAITTRTRELSRALGEIAWDIFELDRPILEATIVPTLADGDGALASGDDDAGSGDGTAAAEGAPEARRPRERPRRIRRDDGAPNRVIWLEEIPSASPIASVRDLRFRVHSSPIELGGDPVYRDFRDRFRRTFYISATLRVGRDPAHAFDYVRERLALEPGRVEAIPLDSPFDMASQARLLAFDDFPSWTEQAEAAMRTVAHQLGGYAREMVRGDENGAMVLTTAKATAAGIGEYLLRNAGTASLRLSAAEILGNRRAIGQFAAEGGILVGTKGLWQGVDIAQPERLRLVWINKLPFPSFEDPVIKTRRALVGRRAAEAGAEDPDAVANETYYLPLAAIELRQAVGRLIRGADHRGVIVISDRKLAGPTRLRRLYREVFLGSLDAGLLVADPETGEAAGGNIVPMAEGWRRIWAAYAGWGLLDPERAAALSAPEALRGQTLLPETRAILELRMSAEQEAAWRARGEAAFGAELVRRCAAIAGHLGFRDGPLALKDEQEQAIRAIAAGRDLLAVLPTGFGKSYVFQLPALALPGVTIVVSPLVSLMNDQALELNRSIGGAVRALISPMRESNSRTGKAEVADQLTGTRDHDIRIVYLSPERLCARQFQDWIRAGVEAGTVRRIALDEAHTFVTWGDDFRPSFRRAEQFLRRLKTDHPELVIAALTATATASVRNGLRRSIFGLPDLDREGRPPVPDPPSFAHVTADPLRTNLALWARRLGPAEGGPVGEANTALSVVRRLDRHAIIYCLTVKQAVGLHNLLLTALGEQERDRIKLYHGRLADGQKAMVLSAFRGAPHFDPDDPEAFSRLIVVATSAFGLGIDRDDIRTVYCASPPTDLAALYQQVGRAGRDGAPATGLMLASRRAFGLLRFMTRRDLDRTRLAAITGRLLAPAPFVDTRQIARDLVAAEVETGAIGARRAINTGLEDQVAVQVVRVLAELAAVGCLEDLGDFPERVRIVGGIVEPDTAAYRELTDAIRDAISDPEDVRLPVLYERLAPAFGAELPDVGAVWSTLLALHGEGFLEVSQQGNRVTLTALRHTGVPLPDRFIERFEARQVALDAEVNVLIDFFGRGTCVNERFASYFGAAADPAICDPPVVRCSWHWNQLAGSADPEPALFAAFYAPKAEFAGRTDFRARELRDLPPLIEGLLRYQKRGLAFNLLHAVLRGREGYSNRDGVWKTLWPALIENRFYRRLPTLKSGELDAAIAELEARGRIVREGGFWRHVDAVRLEAADEERRARRAAAAAARAAAGAPVGAATGPGLWDAGGGGS